MWKVIAESVPGTSPARTGQACQDFCHYSLEATGREQALILACADGAGSTTHGGVGARLTCERLVRDIQDVLGDRAVGKIDHEVITSCFRSARRNLEEEAEKQQFPLRELACTALVAVVGEAASIYAQVGDGAIVVLGEDAHYRPVFPPQQGVYVNETWYLTDPDYPEHLWRACRPGRIDELALFTDGLQRVALNYRTWEGHRPFLAPLFEQLRAAEDWEALREPMRQFLDSPLINRWTDDDKTLMLATRVSCSLPLPIS